jgi:hypothetical protein
MGRREGLLKGIEMGLELRFGAAGLQLVSDVARQADLAVLEKVFRSIRAAKTADEVRALLPPDETSPRNGTN